MTDSSIARRSMIRRAAAVGASAWTAPVLLDSLASPAAAASCASTCKAPLGIRIVATGDEKQPFACGEIGEDTCEAVRRWFETHERPRTDPAACPPSEWISVTILGEKPPAWEVVFRNGCTVVRDDDGNVVAVVGADCKVGTIEPEGKDECVPTSYRVTAEEIQFLDLVYCCEP